MLSSRHFATALAGLLCVASLRAQTVVQWNDATSDFTSTPNWVGPLVNDTTSSIALFQGYFPTSPVLSSPFSLAGVRFGAGAGSYDISGSGLGQLTLGAAGIENLSTSMPQAVSSPLVFSTAASKIINQGDLLVSGTITNNTTGGLTLGGAGLHGEITGTISGTGSLIMDGSGRWTLSAANTYTGSTTVKNGTLFLGADNALPAGKDVLVTPAQSGIVTLDLGGTQQTVGNLSLGGAAGSESVVDLGGSTGKLTLLGNISVSSVESTQRASIRNDGELNLAGTTHTISVTGGELEIAASINGAGGLVKTGAGVLILTSENAYAGGTTVSGGTLRIGNFGSTGRITGDVANSGTLQFAANGEVFSGVISGAGNVLISGYTRLTGNNTYTGNTIIDPSGSLTIGEGGTTGTVLGPIINDGQLSFNRSDSISYSGISGSGAVHQDGTGTLTLSGNTYTGSTFISAGTVANGGSGAFGANPNILMNGGTLYIGFTESVRLGDWESPPSGIFAPGNVVISGGVSLKLHQGSTFSGDIGGAGSFVVGAGAHQVSTGTISNTGGITIEHGASLQVGNDGTAGSLAGAVVNNGSLLFKRSDSVTVGGISGTGSIEQDGTGTLTLAAGNSYSGVTIVSAGTVTNAASGAFGSNPVVLMNGGTVNLAFSETLGLSDRNPFMTTSTGNVNIATGATLTLNRGNRFAGDIAGDGALVLRSGVSQTFVGSVAHTGGTTVESNASLWLGDGGTGGTISGDILNNGRIFFQSTGTATYGGVISGSGQISLGSFNSSTGGNLTVTGANTYTGRTTLNAGTLIVGAANSLPTTGEVFINNGSLDLAHDQTVALLTGNSFGSGSINLGGNATLTVSPAAGSPGSIVFGQISGTGNLSFTGASDTSIVLAAGNTYSGATTISGGTVYIQNESALGTGQVSILGGALLMNGQAYSDYNVTNAVHLGNGAIVGGFFDDYVLNLSGPVTVSPGSTTVKVFDYVALSGSLKSTGGDAQLVIESPGAVPNSSGSSFGTALFLGSIDPSITAVTLNTAGLSFGSTSAVPTAGALTIKGTNGYVGINTVSGFTTPTAASVLALLDPANYSGVLGFDTADEDSGIAVYTENLNLTGFGNVSLGSETAAVLKGTITPAGGVYKFGNGGGALVVDTPLTGNRSVQIESNASIPENHLLTILRGTNDFTGPISVSNSLAVLDSAQALPAGKSVSLGANGYLGYTEAFTGVSFNDFISTRIASGYLPSSVVGIDSHNYIEDHINATGWYYDRTFSETIDMRNMSSIYLGTMSLLTLDGPIYAPAQGGANGTLSLLATNDGQLTVNSSLIAGQVNSVVVGSSTSPYGDGAIALSGYNTYAGGTTLKGGTLLVGSRDPSRWYANPLGTGTLTVAADANDPELGALGRVNLRNSISLGRALRIGSKYLSSAIPTFTGPTTGTMSATYSEPTTSGYLQLSGVISDLDTAAPGSLDVYSDVALKGANTFSGGVRLYQGEILLGNDSALGTGTLTFLSGPSSMPTVLSSYEARTIANNIVIDGSNRGIDLEGGGAMTFSGSVTLFADATLRSWGTPVNFTGGISGSRRLISSGNGTITLSGPNTYTGGTEVQNGAVIFANAAALPAQPFTNALKVGSNGYIGLSFVPANLQTDFVNRFNKFDSSGVIGFDTPAGATASNIFSGNIDLSGFSNSVRLGSTSRAILTGTILPSGSVYRFGGGGGRLEVASPLTNGIENPRSVSVSSSSAPLTLRLSGANTFSGGMSVANSAVIFGPGALPASGYIAPDWYSYVGTEDATHASNPSSFITRLSAGTTGAIVGFDNGLNVTGDISLGHFASTSSEIVLGSSSSATLSGNITLAGSDTTYRFAGYKGGRLSVATTLTSGSVVIGKYALDETFSDSTVAYGPLSSVLLLGANSYVGGTRLEAGLLEVGNDLALGTSYLSVGYNRDAYGRAPALSAFGGARTLSNSIELSGSTLDITGPNDLTLSGSIFGSGGALTKLGVGTLTVSGNNTAFSGDFNVVEGAMVFQTGTAMGEASLNFDSKVGASATFLDTTTIVGGISGYHADDVINLTDGKALTINQQYDGDFAGRFAGGATALTFTGNNAALFLSGSSTFTGSVNVANGITIVAENDNAFGNVTNTVALNGGIVALDSGVTLANPMTITSGGLAGFGTFKAATAGYAIGANVSLSPGMEAAGTMSFDGSLLATSVLLLNSGGTYNWTLNDAITAGGWDLISVNGIVSVGATAADPFNIRLETIGSDGLPVAPANFDPMQAQSWTLLTANAIDGFTDPAQFRLLMSPLYADAGSFHLSLNPGNTALSLNFTPVPEPSTYALMLAGLGITFFASRRRRKM